MLIRGLAVEDLPVLWRACFKQYPIGGRFPLLHIVCAKHSTLVIDCNSHAKGEIYGHVARGVFALVESVGAVFNHSGMFHNSAPLPNAVSVCGAFSQWASSSRASATVASIEPGASIRTGSRTGRTGVNSETVTRAVTQPGAACGRCQKFIQEFSESIKQSHSQECIA